MYSCLVTRVDAAARLAKIEALIKPESNYDFFLYKGKTINLPYRGKEVPLIKGQRFGVRKSADKKSIRLVMGDEINKVFTIDLPTAQKIAKNIEGA